MTKLGRNIWTDTPVFHWTLSPIEFAAQKAKSRKKVQKGKGKGKEKRFCAEGLSENEEEALLKVRR